MDGRPLMEAVIAGINEMAFQGTGSYPPADSGWHRPIRRTVNQPPLRAPYLSTAS